MNHFPVLHSYQLNDEIRRARDHVCYLIISVPWEMVKKHSRQAQANHGQTLERLAQRGGLSPAELIAVLQDRPWKSMSFERANRELVAILHNWEC